MANPEIIDRLFRDDRTTHRRFRDYLDRGFVGILMYDEEEWMSYMWMSLPDSMGPLHLPKEIRDLAAYWLFSARTRTEYRGRGQIQVAVQTLMANARKSDALAEIYADVAEYNSPSRVSLERLGFVSHGLVWTGTLRLPFRPDWVLHGQWDRIAPHPPRPKTKFKKRVTQP